jgi:hypothetical protein
MKIKLKNFMVVRTRATNGRFSNTPTKGEENIIENPIPINIHKETVIRILKLIFLIFIISPWIVLASRKHSIENISKGIIDFYDDNFSCHSYCQSLSNNTDAFSNISKEDKPPKKTPNF